MWFTWIPALKPTGSHLLSSTSDVSVSPFTKRSRLVSFTSNEGSCLWSLRWFNRRIIKTLFITWHSRPRWRYDKVCRGLSTVFIEMLFFSLSCTLDIPIRTNVQFRPSQTKLVKHWVLVICWSNESRGMKNSICLTVSSIEFTTVVKT